MEFVKSSIMDAIHENFFNPVKSENLYNCLNKFEEIWMEKQIYIDPPYFVATWKKLTVQFYSVTTNSSAFGKARSL